MKKTKQAQSDFTFAQLPHNRKEVFIDCIKLHWKLLLCLGLILLLFCVPIIGTEAFKDIVWSSIYSRLTNGEITQDQATAYLSSLQVLAALIDIFGWAIFSVGLSGVARIVRQLAWGEPIFFASDFTQGIKQNVGRFVAVFAICAAAKFAEVFFKQWFAQVTIAAYIPLVLFVCGVLPIGLWILAQTVVYDVTLGKACGNATAFLGKNLWQTMLFVLSICAVELLSFVSSAVLKYVVLVIIIVVILPLYCLMWFLFCSVTFDKFINANNFKELYDKGVYRLDSPVK